MSGNLDGVASAVLGVQRRAIVPLPRQKGENMQGKYIDVDGIKTRYFEKKRPQ
jgi:hypothetical protein